MSEMMNKDRSKECKAFCPECGSDLYFSKEGCYCKGSFQKNSTCTWICTNCAPRMAVAK